MTDDETLEVAEILAKSFKDPKNIALWFMMPNPHFDGVSPAWMVCHGEGDKMLKWMRVAMVLRGEESVHVPETK